jgi:hypothetical protein
MMEPIGKRKRGQEGEGNEMKTKIHSKVTSSPVILASSDKLSEKKGSVNQVPLQVILVF